MREGAPVTSGTLAKTVLIFICPFISLAEYCAASLAPRQHLKGGRVRKNGRLSDSFGVAEEALLGTQRGN